MSNTFDNNIEVSLEFDFNQIVHSTNQKDNFPNCDAHKFGISRDSIRDSFDFFAKNFSYSYLQYFIDLNCSLFGMWKKKCVYLFLLHSSLNLLVFHSIPCPYQTYYDLSLNVALQEFVWKMKL